MKCVCQKSGPQLIVAKVIERMKNRSKRPVLIGLEKIVQRQVGVGVGRGK